MKLFNVCFAICVFLKAVGGQESCSGEHEYRDDVGDCRACQECPPGQQPSMHHCGWGSKDDDFRCIPCGPGTYSANRDHQLCVTCDPCTRWNSYTSVGCTRTANSRCSSCYEGFYRPVRSDGRVDNECHPCKEGSDNPECKRTHTDWKLVTIVLMATVSVLVVLIVASVCWRRKLAAQSRKDRKRTSERNQPGPNLWKVLMCRDPTGTVTSTSLEPLTQGTDFSPDKSALEWLDHSRFEVVDVGPSTYTNLPTAQFQSDANGQADGYSHAHTDQFVTNDLIICQEAVRQGGGESGNYTFEVDAFDTTSANIVNLEPTLGKAGSGHLEV